MNTYNILENAMQNNIFIDSMLSIPKISYILFFIIIIITFICFL